MKQLAKMATYLLLSGIAYKTVSLTNGQTGIMADTDYEGLYPSQEALALQEQIDKKAKQLQLTSEARGYSTAVLIKECDI